MTPIGNMIATLDGFKPLKEVLDGYHKAIELEKENARLREALEEIKVNGNYPDSNIANNALKGSKK